MAITIDTVSKNKWISGIINQKKLYEDHLVCTSNFLKKKNKTKHFLPPDIPWYAYVRVRIRR